MPDIAKIEAVAAKLDAPEGAEPAPETAAAPPAGGPSGAGSAPADEGGAAASPDAGTAASPGATIDPKAIEEKLAADRARRAERARQRQLEEEREAARRQAEEDREAARKEREEAEKWKKMSWKERALAEGKSPLDIFNEMKDEALKAGTPEARLEAMDKAWQARFEAVESQLTSEREERERERQQAAEERKQREAAYEERLFQADFTNVIARPEYESLRDEYEDAQLFALAQGQRKNPAALLETARSLGVRLQWEEEAAARIAAGEDLTDEPPTFTMIDILNVFAETQRRHLARIEEQRRKRTAAPQTGPGAPAQQAPVATRPTVNGTAERNAGTPVGNHLAATTAAEAPSLKGLSREEKIKRLGEKYG